MLELIRTGLEGIPGLTVTRVPDPTNNPLDRLRVDIDPGSLGISAGEISRKLMKSEDPVVVRGHEVELGHFFIDVCNMNSEEAERVLQSIRSTAGK